MEKQKIVEPPFEFADESKWSNERLQDRAKHLGEHVVHVTEDSPRQVGMYREIANLVFELSARNLLVSERQL